MKCKRLLAIAILSCFVFVTAAQTGEKKSWPSTERNAFISSCIESAMTGMSKDSARFYCYCMQEKIEAIYPTIEAAATITEEDMATPAMQKEVLACINGGNWSTSDREDFLESCISSAKDGIGEEKAKTYCGCMLYKIEKMYPDAKEAGKISAEELTKPFWQKLIQECMNF